MDAAQVAALAAHFQSSQSPSQQPPYSVGNNPNTVANMSPNLSQPTPSHPSYAEMIASAIMFDNSIGKGGGSSKRAIAKYIDRAYSDLPPTHSALLTHHLKRLKNSGQLIMIKNSYQLPSFSAPPSQQLPIIAPSAPDQSSTVRRKPGRPPKAKQPETEHETETQPPAEPGFFPVNAPVDVSGLGTGLNEGVVNGNGNGGSLGKRPRGRPPKEKNPQLQVQQQVAVPFVESGVSNGQVKRRGRPPKKQQYVEEEEVEEEVEVEPVRQQQPDFPAKRRPGRPAKANTEVGVGVENVNNVVSPVSDTEGKKRGWPKGKPRGKGIAARFTDEQVAVNVVYGGKKRGRKPKGFVAAVATKVDKPLYTGKPRGRPKKNFAHVENTSKQDQQMANEELLTMLHDMQSKLNDAVRVIRPHFTNQSAPDALAALQQLEELSTKKATPSPTVTESPALTVTAPPQSTSIPETSVASIPNLTAPTMMAFTASPAMNVPLPFSMNVNAPFPAPPPPSIENQQPMSWAPSNEA